MTASRRTLLAAAGGLLAVPSLLRAQTASLTLADLKKKGSNGQSIGR